MSPPSFWGMDLKISNKITLKSILCYCDIAFWWCWWWWGGWDGVLMLLMLVINPWNCLFRIRKHCCFCVCSSRVDVRMSAAWGGKFCVNIFCFRDPQHCVVFTFPRLPQETCFSRFKLNDHLLWVFKTSCRNKIQFLMLTYVVKPFLSLNCVLQIY